MNRLPDASVLKKERDQRDCPSYREIGKKYGVSGSAVWCKLHRAGLLTRCQNGRNKKRDEVNFQARASTALALIRDGKNTYRELADGLGYCTHSAVDSLVKALIDLGLVTKEPNKARTLQLTELGRQSVPLIQLATGRTDGVLEAY